jgi:hypothetical protein
MAENYWAGVMSDFDLRVVDKANATQMVNQVGSDLHLGEYQYASDRMIERSAVVLFDLFPDPDKPGHAATGIAPAVSGLATHEGRKLFLENKLGITGDTPDNYRLALHTSPEGNRVLFKGHQEGSQLIFTESLPLPTDARGVTRREEYIKLLQSEFKPIKTPIRVDVKNVLEGEAGELKGKLDGKTPVVLTPEEQAKLNMNATFAQLAEKSLSIALDSQAALPYKQGAKGVVLQA